METNEKTFKSEEDGLELITTIGFLGGVSWRYKNKKKETLSIICHLGSYGREQGKFEIYPPGNMLPKNYNDSVIGYLTFGEVQEYIDKFKKRR